MQYANSPHPLFYDLSQMTLFCKCDHPSALLTSKLTLLFISCVAIRQFHFQKYLARIDSANQLFVNSYIHKPDWLFQFSMCANGMKRQANYWC